ncbi:MAG: hypothetical protein ACR2F6_05060 [Mycobacteriales bacterium]
MQPVAKKYDHQLMCELETQLDHRLGEMRRRGQIPEDMGDPRVIARLMVQTLPQPHPLAERTGPFYDTPGLVRWLGITRQALDARVRNRTLLGLPTAGGGPRVYPVWQFSSGDKAVIPHLQQVLRILASGSSDPWTWALWLSSRNDETYDGLSAAAWLDGGRGPEPILAEARADAARWAA